MEYAEQIAAPSHQDTFSEVLAKELLAMMNPRMRMLFERRAEGYSWDEIGRDLGIDPHIAKQQFSFGLRTLGERINGSPQEFDGTRILGCFLEDHKFGPGRGHALGLQ